MAPLPSTPGPQLQPSSRAPRRASISRGPVRAPTRAAGSGGGRRAGTRQSPPAFSPGTREGAFPGLGRRLPAGPVDLPRTPQEANAGTSGSGGCGSCTSGSRRKAALETAQPATACLATAPRLRTRAGQRAPRSYRKASTHGGGASTSAGVASTSAGVASALSTPAARLLGLGLCWPSTHSSFLLGYGGIAPPRCEARCWGGWREVMCRGFVIETEKLQCTH